MTAITILIIFCSILPAFAGEMDSIMSSFFWSVAFIALIVLSIIFLIRLIAKAFRKR